MGKFGHFQTDEHINRATVRKVWLCIIAFAIFMFALPTVAKWSGWMPQRVDKLPHIK